jgi:hypothetical protein
MIDSGLHRALDLDEKPGSKSQQMAKEWVEGFGGNFHSIQTSETLRAFAGIATVRVRATVAEIPPNDASDQHILCGYANSRFADHPAS